MIKRMGAVLLSALLLVFLSGCPNGEHPKSEHPTSEHPKSEHPTTGTAEHPSEHPTTPSAEHPTTGTAEHPSEHPTEHPKP